MSVSSFSPAQRRVAISMVIAVVIAFAIFAGFVITYTQGLEDHSPVVTPALPSWLPTPRPTLFRLCLEPRAGRNSFCFKPYLPGRSLPL